jgi:L-rhamnose mutarotase
MRKTIIGVSILAVLIGVACLFPKAEAAPEVKRYGSVIGLKADKIDYYKKLHAETWPEVLKMIEDCNIRNYSIYLHQLDDDKYYLFSYFEYVGEDFEADMAKMAADPMTQKWWKETDPCQFAVKHRKEGEWWASMEEVFHCP